MTNPLRVLRFEGIHADTLGHYFGGLGLLAAVSSRWPGVRGCWRGHRFALVHPTLTLESVVSFLSDEWQPTSYKRWWSVAQSSKKEEELAKARNKASLW